MIDFLGEALCYNKPLHTEPRAARLFLLASRSLRPGEQCRYVTTAILNTRNPMIQRIACISLFFAIFGCSHDVPTATGPIATTAKPECRIERSTEAEAVLKQLGQNAWVFRYSGGALNPDLKVTYKAAGKDSVEETVFDVDGQQTLDIVNSRGPSQHETDLSRGGFIIVTFPDSGFSDQELLLSFSLDGTSSFANADKDAVPAQKLAGPSYGSFGGNVVEQPTALSPGESRVLSDWTVRRWQDKKIPADERETIRYVLTVTALTDAEILEHDRSD